MGEIWIDENIAMLMEFVRASLPIKKVAMMMTTLEINIYYVDFEIFRLNSEILGGHFNLRLSYLLEWKCV